MATAPLNCSGQFFLEPERHHCTFAAPPWALVAGARHVLHVAVASNVRRVATVELLTPAGAAGFRTLALCRRNVPGRWLLWRWRPAVPLLCFPGGWSADALAPVCAVRVSLAPAGEASGNVRIEVARPYWWVAWGLRAALVAGAAGLCVCCCAGAVAVRAWRRWR